MRNKQFLLLAGFFFLGASVLLLSVLVARGMGRSQQATPSRAADDTTKCQGNKLPSAKCFDCVKDNTNDQINMLDYSCFAKYFNQNVGKP